LSVAYDLCAASYVVGPLHKMVHKMRREDAVIIILYCLLNIKQG